VSAKHYYVAGLTVQTILKIEDKIKECGKVATPSASK
jgi:hypothetical protein